VKLVATPAHVAKAVQVATSGRVQRRGALRDCFAPLAMGTSYGNCCETDQLNLRASDYQKPLPDNADRARTCLASSADASGRCGLVPDVGGCSG
jgi:hypothetical protein